MAFVFNKLNNMTGNANRVQDMLAGGQAPVANENDNAALPKVGNALTSGASTGINQNNTSPEQAGQSKFQSPTELLESGKGMGGNQVAEKVGKKAAEQGAAIDAQAQTFGSQMKAVGDTAAQTANFINTGVGDAAAIKNVLDTPLAAAPEITYDPSGFVNVGNRSGREAILSQGRGVNYTPGMLALDSALLGRTGLSADAVNAVNAVPAKLQAAIQAVGNARGLTQKQIDDAKNLVTSTQAAELKKAQDEAKRLSEAQSATIAANRGAAQNKYGSTKDNGVRTDLINKILQRMGQNPFQPSPAAHAAAIAEADSIIAGLSAEDQELIAGITTGLINPNVTDYTTEEAITPEQEIIFNRLAALTGGNPLKKQFAAHETEVFSSKKKIEQEQALLALKERLGLTGPRATNNTAGMGFSGETLAGDTRMNNGVPEVYNPRTKTWDRM